MNKLFFIHTVLLLACAACTPAPSPNTPQPPSAPPVPTASPLPTAVVMASPTPETPSLTAKTYWAMSSFSDSTTADPDWANGEPDVTDCSEPVLPVWSPSAGDQPETLTLAYPVPVLASQLDIYYIGQPGEIIRVEAQNSLSGLGRLLFDAQETPPNLPDETQCPARLSLPVHVDFEVDLVILTVTGSPKPVQIDAVGLTGELRGYLDLPVLWRVPLANTPVSLAAGKDGLIYVITEPNGLYAYDTEGNQLKKFQVPSEALLTDITTASSGNLLVVDEGYGWFILMSPEGEHLTIGGSDLRGQAAIHPSNGNFYVLKGGSILVYTEKGDLLDEMLLDETAVYSSLAFDRQSRLFVLRNPQWQPELLQLDPLTGSELDAIPLSFANQYPIEIVARDLAIDANGNFYILFQLNTGQIAVHVLDRQGNLLYRFGRLTADMDDWTEGAFLDPHALAVSPDGRFIVVADGWDETSYLTAFLKESE